MTELNIYTFIVKKCGKPLSRTGKTGFDFCIADGAPEKSFDTSLPLIREDLMLAMAADHPLAARDRVAVRDLREESFACLAAEGSLWTGTLLQCRQQGFEPKTAILCDDLYCLINYIAAGMGVSVAPAASWRDFQGREVVFRPTEPAMGRETRLFWDSRRTLSAAMRLFRDHAVEYFANLEA